MLRQKAKLWLIGKHKVNDSVCSGWNECQDQMKSNISFVSGFQMTEKEYDNFTNPLPTEWFRTVAGNILLFPYKDTHRIYINID